MPDAEQLLSRIEQLKAVAKEQESKQERARLLEEQARAQLDDLTEKLAKFFGTLDWSEAEKMLPELRAEAQRYLSQIEGELGEAGLL